MKIRIELVLRSLSNALTMRARHLACPGAELPRFTGALRSFSGVTKKRSFHVVDAEAETVLRNIDLQVKRKVKSAQIADGVSLGWSQLVSLRVFCPISRIVSRAFLVKKCSKRLRRSAFTKYEPSTPCRGPSLRFHFLQIKCYSKCSLELPSRFGTSRMVPL